MITDQYTVESKTSKLRGIPQAELRKDPDRTVIGQYRGLADLPGYITLYGAEAENVELGDRFKLTLEKLP